MKKKLFLLLAIAGIMLCSIFPAYAGQWVQNETGWWYDMQDGTWPAAAWKWIGGKCYYFDQDGYCYMNPGRPTPDGYYVDSTGAWVVDGVVQTQEPAQAETVDPAAALIGKWHRTAEYNLATGIEGNDVEKYLEISRSGDGLWVDLYLYQAAEPSVSYPLIYDGEFWLQEMEESPFLKGIYVYYFIDEETGLMCAFDLNYHVEEFERVQ